MADLDSKVLDRFWSKIQIGAANECWPWTAARFHNGYGAFSVRRKAVSAHRIAYMAVNGGIPSSALVLHSCDNRWCCNPAHLRSGTYQDNTKDMIERGRSIQGRRFRRIPDEVKAIVRSRIYPQPIFAAIYGLGLRSVAKIQGAR